MAPKGADAKFYKGIIKLMILKHSIDNRGGNNLNHQQIQPEWDQLYSSPDQIPEFCITFMYSQIIQSQ
jgi:hypothetical protein